MTNILLIGEDYIKTNSGLNENIYGKFLLPAIRETQDMKLQPILGDVLYKKILLLVKTGEINDYRPYKSLLDDLIQPYLMYMTISNLIPIIGVKMGNLGVVISNDEHIVNLSQGERDLVQNYYSQRAEFYGLRLQSYLEENKYNFPELKENNSIKPNLNSIAESGIWLGGKRAKK